MGWPTSVSTANSGGNTVRPAVVLTPLGICADADAYRLTRRSRYGTTDRNADAVKLAQTIGADEGIVADGKQVDQVLDLTDGTGAGVIVDFQTAIDDLDAARIRGHRR